MIAVGVLHAESGKLNTWGSTTELGQCYLISGKQQVSARLEWFYDSSMFSSFYHWEMISLRGVSRRMVGALSCHGFGGFRAVQLTRV